MHPEKRLYKASQEPTSHVAMHSSLAEDLYVVLAGADTDSGKAIVEVFVNPLVAWVWIGGAVVLLGARCWRWCPAAWSARWRKFGARKKKWWRKTMFEGTVASGKWRVASGPKFGAAILAAIVFATTIAFAAASKPTHNSIGQVLICQCGCGQTVYGCNHFECGSRAEMNALIDKEIAAGKDETTILQDFVKQYGVQVLALPPARGFALMAWVLPGLGLIVGLALVIVFVRRWRHPPSKPDQPPPATIDPKILEAVEEEMKKVAG